MSDLDELARPAVDDLLKLQEGDLYAELGARLHAVESDPSLGASFAPTIDISQESFGVVEDLQDFGRRYFELVSAQAYDLVCGSSPENAESRKKVADAFEYGKTAVATAITTALVAQLGFVPAIAAVVATIVISVFFRSAKTLMCQVWKEHLPQPAQ
jgi:hypothetical protein